MNEVTGSTPRTELPMSITNEQMRLLMKAMEKDPHIGKAAAKAEMGTRGSQTRVRDIVDICIPVKPMA